MATKTVVKVLKVKLQPGESNRSEEAINDEDPLGDLNPEKIKLEVKRSSGPRAKQTKTATSIPVLPTRFEVDIDDEGGRKSEFEPDSDDDEGDESDSSIHIEPKFKARKCAYKREFSNGKLVEMSIKRSEEYKRERTKQRRKETQLLSTKEDLAVEGKINSEFQRQPSEMSEEEQKRIEREPARLRGASSSLKNKLENRECQCMRQMQKNISEEEEERKKNAFRTSEERLCQKLDSGEMSSVTTSDNEAQGDYKPREPSRHVDLTEARKQRSRLKRFLSRLNRSEADLEKLRFGNYYRYHTKKAQMTDEEKRAWTARNTEIAKRWRNSLTGEKLKKYKEYVARKAAKAYENGMKRRRLKDPEYREKQNENFRRYVASETPEKRQKRLRRYKIYQKVTNLRKQLEADGVSPEEIEEQCTQLRNEMMAEPLPPLLSEYTPRPRKNTSSSFKRKEGMNEGHLQNLPKPETEVCQPKKIKLGRPLKCPKKEMELALKSNNASSSGSKAPPGEIKIGTKTYKLDKDGKVDVKAIEEEIKRIPLYLRGPRPKVLPVAPPFLTVNKTPHMKTYSRKQKPPESQSRSEPITVTNHRREQNEETEILKPRPNNFVSINLDDDDNPSLDDSSRDHEPVAGFDDDHNDEHFDDVEPLGTETDTAELQTQTTATNPSKPPTTSPKKVLNSKAKELPVVPAEAVSSTSSSTVILFDLKCSHCSAVFSQRADLTDHINKEHPDKSWKCPVCHLIMLNPSEFQEHFNAVHKFGSGAPPPKPSTLTASNSVLTANKNKFSCIKCDSLQTTDYQRTFKKRADLMNHMKTIHPEFYWPCERCKILKYTKKSLKIHEKVCSSPIKQSRSTAKSGNASITKHRVEKVEKATKI